MGKTSVAGATAMRSAQMGKDTIIMSLDIAHSLADIFDLDRRLMDKNRGEPVQVARPPLDTGNGCAGGDSKALE